MKLSSDLMEKIFKAIIAVLGIFLGYNQYQEHAEHQQIRESVYNLAVAFENVQTDEFDGFVEEIPEYVVNL